MTTSITKMMMMGFSILVFLSALANIVFLTTDINSAYDDLPNTQNVYTVHTKIPQEVPWTGAQVVGKLYRLTEDNVPIVVNGMTFQTDKDVMNYAHLVNLNAMYKQEVEYNADGKLTKITFTFQ